MQFAPNMRPRRVTPRRGFTLLEMMLALAILIAMTAVVWPTISSSMETDALRRSADRVRAALASARTKAMQTGVIHAFRYEPESGAYVIEPWQDDYSEVNASDPTNLQVGTFSQGQSALADGAGAAAGNGQLLSENPNAEQLFDDVTFSAIESQFSSRALQLLQDGGSDQIIFFYPDGTATDAVLRIQIGTVEDDDDTYVEIFLNGLTGLTQKTDLLGPDELTGGAQ